MGGTGQRQEREGKGGEERGGKDIKEGHQGRASRKNIKEGHQGRNKGREGREKEWGRKGTKGNGKGTGTRKRK